MTVGAPTVIFAKKYEGIIIMLKNMKEFLNYEDELS